MKTTQFAAPLLRCAKLLGLSALVVFGFVSLTSNVAKADTVFDFSGTVGDIFGTSTAGMYTGLTESGTINIDTVGGTIDAIDLTVTGDPNTFTYYLANCPPSCVYNFNNGFDEFGLLDIGSSLVGYAGGAIGADSYVALDTPVLGAGGVLSPEVQYSLSGTVTLASAATPEPRYYAGLLGLILIGTLAVARRRQQA
jgi:hypothetical protein